MADTTPVAGKDEPNATMAKFGAPSTCVAEYTYWTVLLRPKQATLGAVVLVARQAAGSFGELSNETCRELAQLTSDTERALQAAFGYDKINYLMLMMNDPDVHFHVLPRYDSPRVFEGNTYTDPGWPGPPELGHVNETDEVTNGRLIRCISDHWPNGGRV